MITTKSTIVVIKTNTCMAARAKTASAMSTISTQRGWRTRHGAISGANGATNGITTATGSKSRSGRCSPPKRWKPGANFSTRPLAHWPEEHWIFGGRRFSPWHQGIDTFNPFVATLLSKGGGLLPLYVLHLVAQKPRYGNEIMDLLAERTNGQWVSNPGAIYPLLTLLENEGFIEGKWEDPEKRTVRIYTITPTGQAEVARIKMIVAAQDGWKPSRSCRSSYWTSAKPGRGSDAQTCPAAEPESRMARDGRHYDARRRWDIMAVGAA